jgi:hypothetical protein
LRIIRTFLVAGVLTMCMLKAAGICYAQDEQSFIRQSVISKSDALVLSIVFPGLGQMTSGQKMKGVSFFLVETVSLIYAVNTHENYGTKLKVYNRDKDIYNKIGTNGSGEYTDAVQAYNDLKDRSDELDDLNTIRNTALITAGIVYAYNIFDALVFSPSNTKSSDNSSSERVKVQSAFIDRTPGIMISKSF